MGKGSGKQRTESEGGQHAQETNHVCGCQEANRRCSKGTLGEDSSEESSLEAAEMGGRHAIWSVPFFCR